MKPDEVSRLTETLPGGLSMRFCILADDLSGACDTGLEFFQHGLSTAICLEPPVSLPEALVLDSESRHLDADAAARRVRDFFPAGVLPADTLYYKKVDSTLRGNIGAELDALRAHVRLPVVFAPAFPHAGRTVEDGRLLVRGRPVHLTFIGQDPQAPVRSALLADALGGADAVLSRRDVRDGRSLRALLAEGARLCCDAATDEDLRELVRACLAVRAPEAILWAGSAGLAGALLDVLLPERALHIAPLSGLRREASASLPVFFMVGSVNPASRAQAEYAGAHGGIAAVPLDMNALLHDAAAEEARLAAHSVEHLTQGRHTMLCAAGSGGQIAPEHSSAVAAACGGVARHVLCAGRAGLFFVTGGETAAHCLKALACTRLELEGAVDTGIPYGRMCDGLCAALPIITKAGGFGGESLLVDICEHYALE